MKQAILFEQMEHAVVRLDSQSEKFSEILRWWAAILQVKACSFHLFQERTQTLTHVVSIGLPNDFVQATFEIGIGESCTGRAAETRMLVAVDDVYQSTVYIPHLTTSRSFGLRSVWAVPIVFDGKLLGTVTVYHTERHVLTEPERAGIILAAQGISKVLHATLTEATHPLPLALQLFRQGADPESIEAVVRQDVLESWARSRAYFGAQLQPKTPPALDVQEFNQAQQNNFNLLKAFRKHMTGLFQRIQDLNCTVLLCDPDGWLIDILGSSWHIHQLKKSGLQLGYNISEVYLGNTSIGTALATGQAVYFHGREHYFSEFHHMSSAGAPIVSESDGRVLGAFAFVTFVPEMDTYVPLLVQSACVAIANHYQLEEYRQDVLRVQHSLISQLDYHVLLLDSEGRIENQRHPVLVSDEIRQRMLELTRELELSGREIVIGDRTFSCDIRHLWDPHHRLKGKLGLFRDITDSKLMEVRIHDAEKLSTLTSLVAGIAHEIRNPLTTARGFLQLFTERQDSEQDRRFLDLTIAELDRINQLVKDFMSMAKPDKPHYDAVNITEAVKSIAEFILPEASLRGVYLEREIPPVEVWVWADANQLKQVVLNIAQNALQACTSKGVVRISMRVLATEVEISVQDTGCGMTPEQVSRVFQPFFTTKQSGTGLGLAICKQIIDEHDGTITVDTKVGVGTTMRIRLMRIVGPSIL